jgi:hypothetical protein
MAHLYIATRHRCTADTGMCLMAVARRSRDKVWEGNGFISSFSTAGKTVRGPVGGGNGSLPGR